LAQNLLAFERRRKKTFDNPSGELVNIGYTEQELSKLHQITLN
jgi:hypothetical protein